MLLSLKTGEELFVLRLLGGMTPLVTLRYGMEITFCMANNTTSIYLLKEKEQK